MRSSVLPLRERRSRTVAIARTHGRSTAENRFQQRQLARDAPGTDQQVPQRLREAGVPEQVVVPLLRNAVAGRSFIDPEIEARVQEVRHWHTHDPLELLEPNEREVVALLAQGLTNEQIALRLDFRDSRAVSRTNGQIYTAWGLNDTPTDEKVARTRAAIIYLTQRMILWDPDGSPRVSNERGEREPSTPQGGSLA
jgi:hypothetical protein